MPALLDFRGRAGPVDLCTAGGHGNHASHDDQETT